MIDNDVDEFLEHYGLKGMKWGIRNSKKKAGVNRFKGAQLDRNDRAILYAKRAQKSKGTRFLKSIRYGRAWLERPQAHIMTKEMISHLKSQDKRIKAGKTNVLDNLNIYGKYLVNSVYAPSSIPQLFISNRPKNKQ